MSKHSQPTVHYGVRDGEPKTKTFHTLPQAQAFAALKRQEFGGPPPPWPGHIHRWVEPGGTHFVVITLYGDDPDLDNLWPTT